MIQMGHVVATGSDGRWRTEAVDHGYTVVVDEPEPEGGGEGPNPFGYLLVALAGCTDITLRMYAERKGWPLRSVEVACSYLRRDGAGRDDRDADHIERVLSLDGDLDADQVSRLADIAERTPMTLVVKRGTEVRTSVTPAGAG